MICNMKKFVLSFISGALTVVLVGFGCVFVVKENIQNIKIDGNISVNVTVKKKDVFEGSDDEPIVTEDYEALFMKCSGASLETVGKIKNNPEDYILVSYYLELQNDGEQEFVFVDIGRPVDDGVWSHIGADSCYWSMEPHKTYGIHVCFVAENTEENKTKDFTFPVILQYVYDNSLFEKHVEFSVIP